jgi:hypothetical protein
MASNQSLYGIPRPKTRAKEIPTSSTAAFTNQLSALLAPTSSSTTTAARSRPSKIKSSIFNTHNKSTKKRALADIADGDDNGADGAPPNSATSRKLKLSTRHALSTVDSSTLQRSKRKLEEKARLYSSMKRGDYVPPAGSVTAQVRDANLLVDFDRKWAEAGRPTSFSSSDEESDTADPNERVEYEDEFGRQRVGTVAEARREERRRAAQAHAAETLEELSARPAPPPQLIRGDVIQSAAFNPAAQIAAQMEEMARRRDRSLTPPAETHYDANSEIRSKGVGFYAFSKEEGERRREMEALKREREETERKRRATASASQAEGDAEVGSGSGSGDAHAQRMKSHTDGGNGEEVIKHPDHPYPHFQPHPDAGEGNHDTDLRAREERKTHNLINADHAVPVKPKATAAEEYEKEMDVADRFLDSLDA